MVIHWLNLHRSVLLKWTIKFDAQSPNLMLLYLPVCERVIYRDDKDHPEDTVELCPVWVEHRRGFQEVIGGSELSRPALVEAIAESNGHADMGSA